MKSGLLTNVMATWKAILNIVKAVINFPNYSQKTGFGEWRGRSSEQRVLVGICVMDSLIEK